MARVLIAGGLNGCCQLFQESTLIRRERSLGQGTIRKEIPLSQIGSMALFKPAGFTMGYIRFTHKEMDPDCDENTVIFTKSQHRQSEKLESAAQERLAAIGYPLAYMTSDHLSPSLL